MAVGPYGVACQGLGLGAWVVVSSKVLAKARALSGMPEQASLNKREMCACSVYLLCTEPRHCALACAWPTRKQGLCIASGIVLGACIMGVEVMIASLGRAMGYMAKVATNLTNALGRHFKAIKSSHVLWRCLHPSAVYPRHGPRIFLSSRHGPMIFLSKECP